MKNLLTLILLFATTLVSAQITELTYNETDNALNIDQVAYKLLGEPDLLWGDVVRRHYVPTTGAYVPRDIVRDGRDFTIAIDQYGLQPEQHFVHYGKAGEWSLTLQGLRGATTIELSKVGSRFESQFTVPSEGVWQIWYSSVSVTGAQTGSGGYDEFTVE